ncbi:MAG: hypothetical protein ACJAT4_001737 [Granulosicoccus sp.]|jgi:hypothetical protein
MLLSSNIIHTGVVPQDLLVQFYLRFGLFHFSELTVVRRHKNPFYTQFTHVCSMYDQ